MIIGQQQPLLFMNALQNLGLYLDIDWSQNWNGYLSIQIIYTSTRLTQLSNCNIYQNTFFFVQRNTVSCYKVTNHFCCASHIIFVLKFTPNNSWIGIIRCLKILYTWELEHNKEPLFPPAKISSLIENEIINDIQTTGTHSYRNSETEKWFIFLMFHHQNIITETNTKKRTITMYKGLISPCSRIAATRIIINTDGIDKPMHKWNMAT